VYNKAVLIFQGGLRFIKINYWGKLIMYNTILRYVGIITLAIIINVCCIGCGDGYVKKSDVNISDRPVMSAKRSCSPIKMQGALSEAVWKDTEVYPLQLGEDKLLLGDKLKESGNVRLAWDCNNLYVGTDFKDSDILTKSIEDDMPHYRLGDTCEIFLKPVDQPWFWEIWVASNGKKTAVLWAKRDVICSAFGAALKDLIEEGVVDTNNLKNYRLNLQTATEANKYGWSSKIAIPFQGLDAPRGSGKTQDWLILVARQNYFQVIDKAHRELTMTPKISKTKFNTYEEYAILKLLE
jgi:hypothetical protein